MHITTKSFILRYFCPPGDFKVRLKVTKSLFLGGKMEFLLKINNKSINFYRIMLFHLYICCKVRYHSDDPPADLR